MYIFEGFPLHFMLSKIFERFPNLGHSFFHGVLGDEAVNQNFVLLPEPVGPAERLYVVVRVPVRVVYEDGVRRGQVDAQAARPRRKQEGEVLGSGRCVGIVFN